jgi:hypothetical protein
VWWQEENVGVDYSHARPSCDRSFIQPLDFAGSVLIEPVDHPVINSDWTVYHVVLSLRSTIPLTAD